MKKPRIAITSIAAFVIIGLINSCNSIHISQKNKIHKEMNLEPPVITIKDLLKPKEPEKVQETEDFYQNNHKK